MQIYTSDYLMKLSDLAEGNKRRRQHQNIHTDFDEPCQRLFNAIEPGSYIRPHRHLTVPREELLVAIRGLMALVNFDDAGQVQRIVRFGSEKYGADLAVGVEVAPDSWHTVLALVPGSVLLEVKAGPFDPLQPKDWAVWAPAEGSSEAQIYIAQLQQSVDIQR